jgi:hypothetical protein
MNKPIAWLNPDPDYEQICPEIGFEATICCEQHPRDLGWIPLYAQREWVGLTDDEKAYSNTDYAGKCAEAWQRGVGWAEAKLKEKSHDNND